MSFISISIVIPAFNEDAFIGEAIDSINQFLGAPDLNYGYEIIVVDNGSTDSTSEVAKSRGAKVVSLPTGTIAAVRNYGVEKSSGDVLVFLDADICLTKEWAGEFNTIFPRLIGGEEFITGSQCAPPASDNWFLKYWFQSFYEAIDVTHLGSAHLVMTSKCFHLIGGFDERKETGEDYDICRRCIERGYSIENNLDLLVYHYDYPSSVAQFVMREAWHGIGDYSSLNSMMASKVAWVTWMFYCLHIVFGCLVWERSMGAFGALGLLLLVLALSTYAKFGCRSVKSFLINTGISYFYFFGRALSPLLKFRRYLAKVASPRKMQG